MRTLAPQSGLAASYRICPPSSELPLWQLVVDLGFRSEGSEAGSHEQTLHLAGASDLIRRRALERGVGEAVERRALRPDPRDADAHPDEPSGRAPEWHSFGLASGRLADSPSMFGRGLADGSPVQVPRGLVDYDQASTRLSADADGRYEPTPSGAASGTSIAEATLTGLLELIERDALMVAWACQLHADVVRPESFGEHAAARMSAILEAYRRTGLDYVVADLRTDVAGVHAYAGLCFDHAGQLAALGSKASTSPVLSFIGCLQEAMQALHLARNVRSRFGGGSVAAVPRTELERARFWSTSAAYQHLRDWARSFTTSSAPAAAPAPALSPQSLSTLVNAVRRVGGDPIVVDLSPRLPQPVRELGWHAVKVLCPGLQPLRMDESSTFSWLSSRTSSASERTGYAASTAQNEFFTVPHPLV